MEYFQELEDTRKMYYKAQYKYEDYVETEIIKFYEKNEYYMFKNFVEFHHSKLKNNAHYYYDTKIYKLLKDFHLSINQYTFTPYTKFNSYCKEKIERLIKLRKDPYKNVKFISENSKLLN